MFYSFMKSENNFMEASASMIQIMFCEGGIKEGSAVPCKHSRIENVLFG